MVAGCGDVEMSVSGCVADVVVVLSPVLHPHPMWAHLTPPWMDGFWLAVLSLRPVVFFWGSPGLCAQQLSATGFGNSQ